MVQRKIGMFVANKIKDEILATPKQTEGGEQEGVRDERYDRYERDSRDTYDALDGQILRDGDGRSLGRAYRVQDVGIYVIARDGRNPAADLRRAIEEDPSRLHFQTADNGRITAIIYVADETSGGAGAVHAARPDDV